MVKFALRSTEMLGGAAGRRGRRHVRPRDHLNRPFRYRTVSQVYSLVFIVYNLYTTVLLVILHHMDTSTSSKGEAIPDFCRSKVSQRPSRGRFGAPRGRGGRKSTSPNSIPGCSKWLHRLP